MEIQQADKLVEQLEEYIELEGTEVGEAGQYLCSLVSMLIMLVKNFMLLWLKSYNFS